MPDTVVMQDMAEPAAEVALPDVAADVPAAVGSVLPVVAEVARQVDAALTPSRCLTLRTPTRRQADRGRNP